MNLLGNFFSYYNIRNNILSKYYKQKIIRFINYNKYKDIKIGQKNKFSYIHDLVFFENSLLGIQVTWHDVYCQVKKWKSIIISKFNYNMQNKHTNELNYDMNFKSKSSHPQNIWNDDIDDGISDTCPLIPITNTLNIEKYVL